MFRMLLSPIALVAASIISGYSAPTEQVAVFSGGCFWGVQAVFQHVVGVTNAVSGYAGGDASTPHGARYKASTAPDDERAAIEAALAHTGGTLSRAAELLGMGRTTLWRKMRAYGISPPGAEDGSSS